MDTFDDFKKPRRLILSIDGGGVRGSMAAQFLYELEKSINKNLYDIFDVYVGTSTGAFIISSIAHMKMSAREIVDKIYSVENAKRIMNKSLIDKIMGLVQTSPKYDGKGKREVINEIVKYKQFHDTDKHVIIPIYDITERKPIFFKSWHHNIISLLDVLDTTSAAPGYFPSVEYSPTKFGIDGGICSNFPALSAYIETLKLYDTGADIRILSIGTGYSEGVSLGKETQDWGGVEWVTQATNIALTGSVETEEYQLKTLCEINNHQYSRINCPLEDITMDDTREENINKLKEKGTELWLYRKDEIMELLFD